MYPKVLFLIYVDDISQAVECHLFLYANDSCLVCQHEDINLIAKLLNIDFSNIRDWFADNKLGTHFGGDKTKSILFASKFKKENIKYGHIQIKQYSKMKYLGCLMDESMSGFSCIINAIHKINNKLKFLYRKNDFLTLVPRHLLYNALIHPHFDYVCHVWWPDVTKTLKHRIQTIQNKYMSF